MAHGSLDPALSEESVAGKVSGKGADERERRQGNGGGFEREWMRWW